jgi:hypothetical protein
MLSDRIIFMKVDSSRPRRSIPQDLDVRFPVGARKEPFFSAALKPALKEAHHMTGYMGGLFLHGEGKRPGRDRENASIIFLI